SYSDNILVKLFISEIVHTEDSFLLKLYYKFNFATEPIVEGSKFKVLPIALGVFKLLLIKQFKTPYSAGVIL
ncbi:hypothetical protein NME87_08075, partial [Staphylococcus haemolyticus]|uniref:hypothetical protein n=1 Tax=Staphylococcus haemolyticus TaxID=1283 RepID=UPI0027FDFC67|nr:hypothetical protein [Staphylococcus haemolyticus]